MSINRIVLPDPDRLKNSLETIGVENFKTYWENRIQKAESIIGNEESIQYLKQFIKI